MMRTRIIAFPAHGIAYNDCLYQAFREQGADVVDGVWAGRWLLEHLRRSDVLHIHWPSFLYAVSGGRWPSLKAFFRFAMLLALARWRAGEIWWTAHNLMPHAPNPLPVLDRLGRRLVIAFSRRVFVHGHWAKQALVARFPSCASKVVDIPHGHWIGYYPPCKSKDEARRRLGLPQDAVVLLLFGQCKPYKNLEGLIQAFRQLQGEQYRLLIAGSFADQGYLACVEALAKGDDRIRIDAGFIADEDVSLYLMACSAMCMPYREILTSGTAMLALSYGRPVLSVKRGFLRDVITPEVGILIEQVDVPSILGGLKHLGDVHWDEGAILEHCRQFSFQSAASLSLACLA